MRRGHNDGDLGNRFMRVAGMLLLAGAGVLVVSQLGTFRRYLKMRRMSARRHETPPGTQTQATETSPRWGTSHWPTH